MEKSKHRPDDEAGRKLFYGYIIVAVATVIIILSYGARFSFGIFFKPMSDEFNWSRALTSGSFTVSMLCQGVGAFIMGRLNDRLGSRFVMTLCGTLLGIGYLLMSLVNNTWELYLIYGVLIGIGMGGPFVSLLSTIAHWFVKRRGIMTGIAIAGNGVGILIIPPVSYWLISVFNWHQSFLIIGAVVLVIGVVLAQMLRSNPTRKGQTPYGVNAWESNKPIHPIEGLTFREAVRSGQFWITSLIFFCLGYGVFTLSVHLVPHITDLGISAAVAAAVLAVSGGLNAVGGISLGLMVDKIGSRNVIAISLFLMAGSIFWLTQITAIWALYLFAVIYGFGAGGGAPIESTISAELFGLKSHGTILGAISFFFTCGGALGPFVTGYLYDINGNYKMAFLIIASICALGAILSLILRPINKKVPTLQSVEK